MRFNPAKILPKTLILLVLAFVFQTDQLSAQHEEQVTASHQAAESHQGTEGEWKIQDMIFEHINNSNEFHIFGHVAIPLPVIVWSKEDGLTTFMSSKLEHGHKAYNRYVLDAGVVKRVKSTDFPAGLVDVHAINHENRKGEEIASLEHDGKTYELESGSTIGKHTSFTDFSISKKVFTMILASIFLIWLFTSVAKAYEKRKGMAPTGKQNLMEVMVNFIIDEVAKPMLGDRYMKYLPFLLTIFFFILTLNLFGLIPFFPFGANVTGNIAVTMALAIITFVLVNINGNGDYWKHIFWMPGIPVPMKIFLAPIELLGIFIKPVSLMIRLFANITAGHIIILSLVGLIFVFGQLGASIGGASAGALIAVPFTLFMNLIELIVALIQAFIFTILAASYIGAATEEAHH